MPRIAAKDQALEWGTVACASILLAQQILMAAFSNNLVLSSPFLCFKETVLLHCLLNSCCTGFLQGRKQAENVINVLWSSILWISYFPSRQSIFYFVRTAVGTNLPLFPNLIPTILTLYGSLSYLGSRIHSLCRLQIYKWYWYYRLKKIIRHFYLVWW